MPYLGCIADDFTGATDLANNLVRGGLRTLQVIGADGLRLEPEQAAQLDAVVVALKSRSVPAAMAVDDALVALEYLKGLGCQQFYFKYCSTFDSTDAGNIGPVAEALLDALDTPLTLYCPAFPAAGRTVYQGYLFVGDRLLSESSMRDHPLTPMTDPDLVRVLGRQTTRKVDKLTRAELAQGSAKVQARLAELAERGVAHVIVDTLDDADLRTLGRACLDLPLVTGGSGLGSGLASALVGRGTLEAAADAGRLSGSRAPAAVLAGSASEATRGQVAWARARWPSRQLDPLALAADPGLPAQIVAWAREKLASGPVLVYATAAPEQVARVQQALGRERAGALVEAALAEIAVGLREAGVRRLVVAGGETSGAVVAALGIRALRIGHQVDPGVPVTRAVPGDLLLALKSGNFGSEAFFGRALEMMAEAVP